jgi:hypothetical protein
VCLNARLALNWQIVVRLLHFLASDRDPGALRDGAESVRNFSSECLRSEHVSVDSDGRYSHFHTSLCLLSWPPRLDRRIIFLLLFFGALLDRTVLYNE